MSDLNAVFSSLPELLPSGRLPTFPELEEASADDSQSPLVSVELEETVQSTSKDGCEADTVLKEIVSKEVNNSFMAEPANARSSSSPALEVSSKLTSTDKSMIDSVTDDMVKVSIEHAMISNKELLQQESRNCPDYGMGGNSESHSGCEVMLASKGVDGFHEKMNGKLQCTNLQERDPNMPAESFEDQIAVFEIEGWKDSNGGLNGDARSTDNEDGDDEDLGGDDNSAMDEDEDEDVETERDSEDSDSSSSTSTLSFSSSSDEDKVDHHCPPMVANQPQVQVMEAESECEEGELKESPSRKKKMGPKKKAVEESSEDERSVKEPFQAKNEMKNLPRVPEVSVTLQPHHTMVPVGFISSHVGVNLIVEGIEGAQALSEGSILWITEERLPLGIVDEIFGPVKKPFYVVRYNDTSEVPEGAREGAQVSYVRDFADFVLNNPDLYARGYDKADDIDEEVLDSEVEFSDDEKEAEYKRLKSRTKRGNSELRVSDVNMRQHQEKGASGKGFNKEDRSQRLKGENAGKFQFNNNFSARPSRQQSRFQHRRSERDPTFQYHEGEQGSPFQNSRMEPMQMHSEGEPARRRSPSIQEWSHQSRGRDLPKSARPPRHGVLASDDANLFQQHVHNSRRDHAQASSMPNSHEEVQPTQSTQSSHSASWEQRSPQGNLSRSLMQPSAAISGQSLDFMQSASQKMPINQSHRAIQSSFREGHMNQAPNLFQSTPQQGLVNPSHTFMPLSVQQVPSQFNQPPNHSPLTSQQGHVFNQSQIFMQPQPQVNQPHSFMQPTMPPSQPWPTNQPLASLQMALSPQGPEVQHSQVSLYNTSLVVGQVPQVAGGGYGMSTTNNATLQSGMEMGQGMLPMHQGTVFQQLPSNQLTFLVPHQLSAQGPTNMGLPTGNQMHVTPANGYPVGVQATDFSAPVLGIPAIGSADASANYFLQKIHNQPYNGFTPGSAPLVGNQGMTTTFGVPDQSLCMQPPPETSAVSWQLPPGNHWQQSDEQRPHHGRAPHRHYRS